MAATAAGCGQGDSFRVNRRHLQCDVCTSDSSSRKAGGWIWWIFRRRNTGTSCESSPSMPTPRRVRNCSPPVLSGGRAVPHVGCHAIEDRRRDRDVHRLRMTVVEAIDVLVHCPQQSFRHCIWSSMSEKAAFSRNAF
jgi:hypothetical protein